MALVEPGRWALASVADVRLAAAAERPPRQLTVHIGAARTVARVRLLGGRIARLTLHDALPLHVGDRLLLRDPGAAARPGPGLAAGDRRAPCWTWPRPGSAAAARPPRPRPSWPGGRRCRARPS